MKRSILQVQQEACISTAQQVAEFAPYADGIVVGSAIVKMIEENSKRGDLVFVISQYVGEMKKAISVF